MMKYFVFIFITLMAIISCSNELTQEKIIEQLKYPKYSVREGIEEANRIMNLFYKLLETDQNLTYDLMLELIKTHPIYLDKVGKLENPYNVIIYPNQNAYLNPEIFDELIRIDPSNSEIYFIYALFASKDKSLDLFEKAINLNPENYLYYYQRAELNNRNKNYTEAINDYSESIRLNPDLSLDYDFNNKNFAFTIALLKSVSSDYVSATIHDETVDVNFIIGSSYLSLNDYDNAILYLTNSINNNKYNAVPYYLRGDIYWQIFTNSSIVSVTDINAQKAVNDWRQAKRINPNIQWDGVDSNYQEIDPFDFEVRYKNSNINRKLLFKSTLIFYFNDGPRYYFKNLIGDTDLMLYSSERIGGLSQGKRVTVYWVYDRSHLLEDYNRVNSIVFISIN